MVGTNDNRPTAEPTTDQPDADDSVTVLSDTDTEDASAYDINTDDRQIITDMDGNTQLTMNKPYDQQDQFMDGKGR